MGSEVTNPIVIMVGTAGSRVGLLQALAMSQINGKPLTFDDQGRPDGATTAWHKAMRDWLFSGVRPDPMPAAMEVEHFDGIPGDVRLELYKITKHWVQIQIPMFLRSIIIDEVVAKNKWVSLSDHKAGLSNDDPDNNGNVYRKMLANGTEDPKQHMEKVFAVSYNAIDRFALFPNVETYQMVDILDPDICLTRLTSILGKQVPNEQMFRDDHARYRDLNKDFYRTIATILAENGYDHINLHLD